MDWLLWLIWTVWMAGSLLSMVNALLYRHFRSQQDQRWLDSKNEINQKKVCWIVAMKGFDKQLTETFFKSLITQSYTNYRIIFTFESDQDEGYTWLRNHLGITEKKAVWYPSISSGLESVSLLVAGPAKDCGQKVHNQIAAFASLQKDDEIIAFADADIICPPETLSRLVVPIDMGHFDVMTTFRWLIPGDSHPATLFGSVINASCATMGGHVFLNTAWGGMVAVERETFEELRIPDRFSRVLSDDLTLNSLVKRSGRTIGFVRSLIVPSPVQFTWHDLFEFGSRQYFMVKFYSTKLYLSAYEVTGFYLAGFISSIIAITCLNNPLGWLPLVAVMLSDQVRAFCRRKIYQYQFRHQPETIRSLDKTILIEHLCTPIWMGLQFIFVVSVLFKNNITWAGIRYRVKAGGNTTVLSHKS